MHLQRIVLLLMAAFLLGGCGYNAFQSKDEAVKAAWSIQSRATPSTRKRC
jgi:LemA protein